MGSSQLLTTTNSLQSSSHTFESKMASRICCVCVCVFVRSVVSDFVTPWAVACRDPLSMGILQARILEGAAISFSRGSSQPRDRTRICMHLLHCRQILYR